MIEVIAPYVGHVVLWAVITIGATAALALMFLGVMFVVLMRDFGGFR